MKPIQPLDEVQVLDRYLPKLDGPCSLVDRTCGVIVVRPYKPRMPRVPKQAGTRCTPEEWGKGIREVKRA